MAGTCQEYSFIFASREPLSLKFQGPSGTSGIKWGIGQYFEILFLAEFHLSCKMQLLIYEYEKENSKIPSEN